MSQFRNTLPKNIRDLYLLIPLLISVVFAWNWVMPADDALITHRYVNNFLERGEPYFNSNDRVLGLSSPGYFLMLAGVSAVFPVTIAYKLIASVAFLLAGIFIYRLFSINSWHNKLLVSIVYASNIYLTYWVFSGMETLFIPLFGMICLWAVLKKSVSVLIIAFGISIIFRPESWFALSPLIIAAILFDNRSANDKIWQLTKRSIVVSLTVVAAIYIALAAFILYYYDNLLPSSVTTKAGVGRLPDMDRIEEFAASIVTPINIPVPFGYLVGVAVITAAVGVVFYSSFKLRLRRVDLALAAGAGAFSLYLILTGASVWGWYYVFITYVISYFLVSAALITIRRHGTWSYAPLLVLVGLALWSGVDYGMLRNERINSLYIDQMQAAAAFIEKNYEDGQNVVVSSSGYFGAKAPNMNVYDSIGLFSPDYVSARKENLELRMTDVIDWDLLVCASWGQRCIDKKNAGRLVGSFGIVWVVENLE